ncbi:DUF6134 family protein [Lacihabitans lacunae]|uniref:DUF6134 family protein n=1 Tax=Lacihabitans lacunae TaxID=1028214 RepID=A0ABV7YRC9_9BACT
MKNRICVLFFMLLAANFAKGQNIEVLNYNIEIAGIKVGTAKAKSSLGANGEHIYHLVSNVDIDFIIFKLRLNYDVKSVFDKKYMQSSNVLAKSNKGTFYTKTHQSGQGYKIDSEQKDGKVNKYLDGLAESSSSSLYFHEPIGIHQVYAEYYGDFIKIKRIREGVYEGELGKNKDVYYYQNHKLVKVVKKNPIKDFVFILN